MLSDMGWDLYSTESFEFKGGERGGQTDSSLEIHRVDERLLQTVVQIHRRSWYLIQR